MRWHARITSYALLSVASLSAAAQQPRLDESPLPRQQWGAPLIEVSHEGNAWTIRGKRLAVTLEESDLALRIDAGSAVWSMAPSSKLDMLVKPGDEEFPVRLADARNVKVARYDTGFKTGVKITLNGWPRKDANVPDGDAIDLTLYLTIALEGKDEELVFDIAADERHSLVRRLDWPAALDPQGVDYTVMSNIRGVLLPRDWPQPYHPIRPLDESGQIPESDTSEVQSNVIECWSMPWWGFQKGPAAMMVIVETPDDAAYQFSHPAGGPTVIGPRWRSSQGALRYVRTARMCFFAEGDYVDMAKRYRQYAIDTGVWVPLKEKISRSPVVERLIGAPLTRLGVLANYKADGARYKRTEDPDERFRLNTFDQRAEFLRGLKSQGLDRLTVVLTGWPRLGYDRQHPDVLPPAPAAGGYAGMKRLADACAELGYLFSLHDQYRDFYVDAPSYDVQFAVHEEEANGEPQAFPGSRFGDWKEGRIPFMDYWDGGKMTYLNGRFMLGHLKKNYQALFDHGIRPVGSYLDVFGYVPPDEDFNPEHPTTRTDCLRERAKCYQWSRSHLGFVGTEAACDWTVPYSDISSPLEAKGGIPVPLFNLVYHDAIMTTYAPDDLHGMLNAGVPQFRSGELSEEQMAMIREMGALHQRLALQEMVDHEFLDANHRQERTRFADGTTVTVDWDASSVRVAPELTTP